jgi:hypothetical protein
MAGPISWGKLRHYQHWGGGIQNQQGLNSFYQSFKFLNIENQDNHAYIYAVFLKLIAPNWL